MSIRHIELLLGLLILIFAASSLLYALQFTNNSMLEQKKYLVHAKFSNVGGVKKGYNITVAGVEVGKVVSVSLDQNDFYVNVSMLINETIPIPDDSSVAIINNTLLGNANIVITPGQSKSTVQHNQFIKNVENSQSLEKAIADLLFTAARN